MELNELAELARAELPEKLSAFEALVKLQLPLTRRLAYGIVGDMDTANSIAQDVMIRAMHALPRLEDAAKYPAWIRRITVNVARTYLARESRERRKRALYAEQAETSYEIAEEGENASFAALLQGLSPDERTIVSLKIIEDLEFAQIAEISGIGVSAAKMRYYRALEKIKASSPPDAEPD